MDELIVTIEVTTYEAQALEGNQAKVVMIPFSGEAKGDYFTGRTLANGVDTQIITEDMRYDAAVLNRKKKALKQLDKIQKLMKEGDDIHINTK